MDVIAYASHLSIISIVNYTSCILTPPWPIKHAYGSGLPIFRI